MIIVSLFFYILILIFFLLHPSFLTYETIHGWKTPVYRQIDHWVIFTHMWLIVIQIVSGGEG